MGRNRSFACGLGALLAAYLGLAGALPPLDDELYYWCWSRQLQLSYFDHPPLTAYLIRASTALFGDTVWAIRLPACLATVAVVGVIGSLTPVRRLWPWVLLTPLFTFGAVLITPDTPLLLMWALYLRWLVAVQARLDRDGELAPAWWLLGGVLLGLGALGKYTMALAVPAGFVSFCLGGANWRRWLPGYLAHGVVSFVCFLPVVVYNVERGFEPILFQWSHAMAPCDCGPWWKSAGDFVGVQLVLFGLMPFTLFGWTLWRARELRRDARLRVCACLYALPFAFFVVKSFRGPLEGNWALASYLGFWPVAGHWLAHACPPGRRNLLLAFSFGAPAAVAVGLAVHLVAPLTPYPPHRDRVSRQGVRVEAARLAADTLRERGNTLPVYTPTYQWVALLRFHGVDARQMHGVSRPSHFTAARDCLQDVPEALVWNEVVLIPELCEGYEPPTILARFPICVRGEAVSGYFLMHYRKHAPEPHEPEVPAGPTFSVSQTGAKP